MVLIPCYDCEKEISDQAARCPHCGAPRREDHKWASISAGIHHTVGITTSGDAYAWGGYAYGQIGDGTRDSGEVTPRPTPTLVSGGHTWASIAAGTFNTVGIITSRAGYFWGCYWSPDGRHLTPTLVSGAWASISAGRYHTVGITTSGEAYAWGSNSILQLGTGDTSGTIHTTPVLVSPHP